MQRQDRFFVVIIFLVTVLSIFHSGEALQCYYCDSKTGPLCPSPRAVVTCPSDMLCTVYTVKISGAEITERFCGFPNACEHLERGPYTKYCRQCNTNLCNAAAINTLSTILMLTSGLITLSWTIQ
ncbi:PREDICTED: CD59 glycoprotein-like [Vollenhovia emeryi]|uniref:CD59 glycoprotein-like n=1 Tax=Vollenhovia emeryi TaxID=411798 RepID=UPI0005F464C5|nr:PREDICTED: CD59 glycoprotein-like [Vollenhovia emeryi]